MMMTVKIVEQLFVNPSRSSLNKGSFMGSRMSSNGA
jgi:hypothetical protein